MKNTTFNAGRLLTASIFMLAAILMLVAILLLASIFTAGTIFTACSNFTAGNKLGPISRVHCNTCDKTVLVAAECIFMINLWWDGAI